MTSKRTVELNSTSCPSDPLGLLCRSPLTKYFNTETMILNYDDEKAQSLFVAAPVAICKNPGKTVGLGDAISAIGLLAHHKGPKVVPAAPTQEMEEEAQASQ